ncbi:PPE family protein [Mycobacterium sp. M1]|uniref:PPE family protein n=1 Tax=Mycolicibacter acidiphilus TaxID=2835306 RepID=A0ABS5RFZ5_9MYCO|nr:PPE domain-containing protein [Mycolicibacter acidiphilus]MBS9533215.1 PPE family protein [Mycolicibacter acidiphilus]
MNFAVLPPEVNSALMYTGAGSGPIRAAATAWQTMATELETASYAYRSVITALTDETWLGPSSVAMAVAAAPYLTWMHTTATQAGHAAGQAEAAAAAYETAFAMTVPPPVVAANRTQLATLVATNLLGQNTPAIAATEAHYAEMWAQDTTAMYGYAADAAQATRLPAFTAPGHTARAAASAADATGGAISPGLAFDLAGAALEIGSVGPFGAVGLGGGFGGLAITLAELAFPEEAAIGFGALGELGLIGDVAPATAVAGRAGAIFASVGGAVPVGALSVPQAWAAAAPAALRQVSLLSVQSATSAAAAAEVPFSEMALAGMAGRAIAGSTGRRDQTEPTTRQLTGAAPPPDDEPESLVKPMSGVEIIAELRGLAELRDAGVLTDAEYAGQHERLVAGANAGGDR